MTDSNFNKYEQSHGTASEQKSQSIVTDEREVLLKRAATLGITHSNNIGLETLRSRINAKLEQAEEEEEDKAQKEDKNKAIVKQRQEATKLIRVIITSMDNMKNELSGEVYTVSNNVVGTIKRFIPFNVEWHVESILLDTLREKKMQKFYDEVLPNGDKIRKGRLAPAYGIQVLEPLNELQLKELAQSQLARNTIGK